MSYDDFWEWLKGSKYQRYLKVEDGWKYGGGKHYPHARRGPVENELREIWELKKEIAS